MRPYAPWVVVILLFAALPASAGETTAKPVVIAVLDTGIAPTHHAFVNGQIVAWYDFTNDAPRSNQTTWDPLVTTPYDVDGHGTAVASMAAGVSGLNLTSNFAPGANLAIGNAYSPALGGATSTDISDGIRWATDVVHADIITMSVGSLLARPFLVGWTYNFGERQVLDSIRHAREQGVLVVLAAGNGEGNLGLVPDASWMHEPGISQDVLVVGGARGDAPVFDCTGFPSTGYLCGPKLPRGEPVGATKDPMVTSDYTVTAACPKSDLCTSQVSGTSVSAPRAASLAAHFLTHARSMGRELSVDQLEWVIKQSALPHLDATPAQEGYGYLDDAAASRGDAILDGAPGPSGPLWEARVAYVEQVNTWERKEWYALGTELPETISIWPPEI